MQSDVWDAEYPINKIRKGGLISTDRVRGSVRYKAGHYITDDELEQDRRKVSDRLSKKR
jgi:hypothetical protein